MFAQADEVVVEELSFGEGAHGMVDTMNDGGTVVIWLDEEP